MYVVFLSFFYFILLAARANLFVSWYLGRTDVDSYTRTRYPPRAEQSGRPCKPVHAHERYRRRAALASEHRYRLPDLRARPPVQQRARRDLRLYHRESHERDADDVGARPCAAQTEDRGAGGLGEKGAGAGAAGPGEGYRDADDGAGEGEGAVEDAWECVAVWLWLWLRLWRGCCASALATQLQHDQPRRAAAQHRPARPARLAVRRTTRALRLALRVLRDVVAPRARAVLRVPDLLRSALQHPASAVARAGRRGAAAAAAGEAEGVDAPFEHACRGGCVLV